jgi:hypothetical protein
MTKKMNKLTKQSLIDSIKATWTSLKGFFKNNIRYASNATTHKSPISKTVSKELSGKINLLVAFDPKNAAYITLPGKSLAPIGVISKAAKENEETTVTLLGNGTTALIFCATDILYGHWVYATESGMIAQPEGIKKEIENLKKKDEKKKIEKKDEKKEEKKEEDIKLNIENLEKLDFKNLIPIGIALSNGKKGSTAEVLTALAHPIK